MHFQDCENDGVFLKAGTLHVYHTTNHMMFQVNGVNWWVKKETPLLTELAMSIAETKSPIRRVPVFKKNDEIRQDDVITLLKEK